MINRRVLVSIFLLVITIVITNLITIVISPVFARDQIKPSAAITIPSSIRVDMLTGRAQVDLPMTPSTGYQWFVKRYPSDSISTISYQYIKPEQVMPGSTGKARFIIKFNAQALSAPRLVPVVFTQARAWQPNVGKDKTVWMVILPNSQ